MNNKLLAGKRVLVVEDEMLVLMGIEDMLSDLGCTSIAVAGNVVAALGLISANVFDLATLDINLSGTRSYSVAEALERHNIPFVFSTGYGEHGVAEGYGERPVLNKPYSPQQFEKVISKLLTDEPAQASAEQDFSKVSST